MTSDSLQLLKQLAPPVPPAYAGGPAAPGTPPLEHQQFDALLARAAQGLIESGRPVTTKLESSAPLDESQMRRLASAADRAEALGARRALMLIDGRGFVLDVSNRQLAAELSPDPPSQSFNLDAALYVAGVQSSPPLAPPAGVAPPAVTDQIESARSARA